MTEVRLEHDHASLYALDQGSGPPLLFFHGGLADHRAALAMVGALAGRLRLLTPDLRGAGRSIWSGPIGWEQLADDGSALLRHLGIDRAVVGGVSMGSGVAARMALSHPDQVAGLILVHPVYPGQDRPISDAAREAMERMDAHGRRAPAEGIEAVVPLLDALPTAMRERATAMIRGFDPGSVAATTRFLASEAQPFGSASELRAIRCPALVFPGTDATHPAEVGALMGASLPGAAVHPSGPDLVDRIERFCREVAG